MACSDFEYSPNQAFDKDSPVDLNAKSLARLQNIENDDTVKFIVFGDPQKSANELDEFIAKVNTMKNVDFAILAGDISEFGLLQETKWVALELEQLKIPHFAVIGNHDLLAKGDAVFKRMFGELNYSFAYDGVKFICHNTNGREYKFNGLVPDINWLQQELKPQTGVESYVAISHIRPFSPDFDTNLDIPYTDVFNAQPKFLASFHAHDHGYGEFFPNNSRVPFVVTTNIGNKGFILATIVNNKISYERINY
ncbi:metallophosphoesterase [Pedobacter psychrophilus]|uniref:Metallophosphoesterase n=2 Tax=Pedobacter psychrophilus TaxID=1826909 RepID=A0A179DGB8_9SPHI|nr:metallophosphoesterase [Pedobacter psychrophilus]